MAEMTDQVNPSTDLSQQVLLGFQRDLCIVFGPVKTTSQRPSDPLMSPIMIFELMPRSRTRTTNTSFQRKTFILQMMGYR